MDIANTSFTSLKIQILQGLDNYTELNLINNKIITLLDGLFKNLKVLSFYYSDYVTKEGLDGIVKNDNNLEEMNILFCDKVTQAHVLDWHKFAIQKNWKLNLFFEDDHTARTNYY